MKREGLLANPPADGIELPSESEVAEASRKLIALRESASTRMLRPMRATASERDHDDRQDDDRKCRGAGDERRKGRRFACHRQRHSPGARVVRFQCGRGSRDRIPAGRTRSKSRADSSKRLRGSDGSRWNAIVGSNCARKPVRAPAKIVGSNHRPGAIGSESANRRRRPGGLFHWHDRSRLPRPQQRPDGDRRLQDGSCWRSGRPPKSDGVARRTGRRLQACARERIRTLLHAALRTLVSPRRRNRPMLSAAVAPIRRALP